jgi:hypothetical protein
MEGNAILAWVSRLRDIVSAGQGDYIEKWNETQSMLSP